MQLVARLPSWREFVGGGAGARSGRREELVCGQTDAVAVLSVGGTVLRPALAVPNGYAAGGFFIAVALVAAGGVIAFATFRDAVAGDPSWLRAARTLGLFFVMLAVGGRASIGLLVVPAAISTFVARWRPRLGGR